MLRCAQRAACRARAAAQYAHVAYAAGACRARNSPGAVVCATIEKLIFAATSVTRGRAAWAAPLPNLPLLLAVYACVCGRGRWFLLCFLRVVPSCAWRVELSRQAACACAAHPLSDGAKLCAVRVLRLRGAVHARSCRRCSSTCVTTRDGTAAQPAALCLKPSSRHERTRSRRFDAPERLLARLEG